MTIQDKAKAFAWDFYVNDVEPDYRKYKSHELYDMLMAEDYLFPSYLTLNAQFEDLWDSCLIPLLKELYEDTLDLLESISHLET